MARYPRFIAPNVPMHVIQRGNNRTIMFHDPCERQHYLSLLQRAAMRTHCEIHAYVLMSNHVHLLLTPSSEQGPPCMMQSLGLAYARYFNRLHHRTGTLFEGRYRSSVVQSDRYFFACSRYIELNPVRAGIATNPSAYPWSSYLRNARRIADPLITPHALYRRLGSSDDARSRSYAQMFADDIGSSGYAAIRRSINAGTALGDDDASSQLEQRDPPSQRRLPHGGDRRVLQHRSTPSSLPVSAN